MRIISTECIANYPDQNLPTVLLYRSTQLKQHIVGLGLFGGRNTTPEGVQGAAVLLFMLCGWADDALVNLQACRERSTCLVMCAQDPRSRCCVARCS